MEFKDIDFKLAAALALGLTLIVFAVILGPLLDPLIEFLKGVGIPFEDYIALLVAFLIIFIPLMCLFMFLSVLIARKR